METEKFRSKLSNSILLNRDKLYRIFLPRDIYTTRFNEIKNSMKFSPTSRSPSISKTFPSRLFLPLWDADSRLIRGNRLPVKVISSDDGKTDSSSHWHHSRRGHTRVRYDERVATCTSFRSRRTAPRPPKKLPSPPFNRAPLFALVTRGTSTPCATKSDGGRPCSGLKSSRHATLGFVVLTKRAHAR